MSRKVLLVLAVLVTLALLGFAWQWLAERDMFDANTLFGMLQGSLAWRDRPWAGAVVITTFVAASLVLFPLSVLVVLAGLIFGSVWGFVYSLIGTLLGAIATFWLGRWLGRDALLRYGGRRLLGLSRYLAGRGVRTITVLNLLPLAPYTLTNLLAGAFHIRFRDFLLGTFIGATPGLAGIILLSSQLGTLLTAEDRHELAWAAGGIAVGLALLYGLKRYADGRQRRRH
ncbi:VTT domain-containing protein [Halomonas sp. MCCC 1A17488]|uniref:TVP38/TMEM64 family membrane protein n=1 Tax=Billgrantia sulfidoxydans TaxID=2733484 RepID=A0ABX7W751_9GAMM|nr:MULTISPECIES: VTT domain-containing protein [Halomonas]MCE8017616.1 VTT domain-containing protein [Halomonas sp. MCCC 1A17488]MCG3240949.1 VTT domain-containing protein [Halomonas sp. MCCC 1A17488]QPP48819.1 VTT domain-containing protein [Halomonas sp. SS10-MC5]QTP56151.1 VTT domain-containing protein [Halomonas sulfidoxydans]